MEPRNLIDFLTTIEKLKCTTRHSWTSCGRRESVAEHSWRLAVMAMLCAEEYPALDMNKVIKMCLIHDFGEAVTGDIPSFLKTAEHEREEEVAIQQLISRLSGETSEELRSLFCEMSEMQTDEAKLYKALDNMEAVLSHNEADISTWLSNEYQENLTYGQENCEWSEWTRRLREELRKDSREKIHRAIAKNITTIVVDLDQTLLRTDKTLSAYTVEVIKRCKERGIRIMIATARPLRTAKPYCDILDLDTMVVSNGARIICQNQRTEYGISRESARRLLTALKSHPNLRITLETGDVAYSNHPIEDYETVISNHLEEVAEAEGALKILIHVDDPYTPAIVQKELSDDLYHTTAHGYMIQIMSRSATKWKGIQAMLAKANCSPEEVAYFGDDLDDLEPIRMCGLGIAVGNGIDEVKAAADVITESNDEDGVAKFIERTVLNNK